MNLPDKDISFLLRKVWLAEPVCCLFSHVEIVTALHHSDLKVMRGADLIGRDWSRLWSHPHTRIPPLSLLCLAPGLPNCQKRFGHTYLWRLAQLRLRCAWFMTIEPKDLGLNDGNKHQVHVLNFSLTVNIHFTTNHAFPADWTCNPNTDTKMQIVENL